MRLIILAAFAALTACGPTPAQQQAQAAIYARVAAMTPDQRNALRTAALQCKYEAHATAAGYRGEIIQAAEERNLGDMCIKAKMAAIEDAR